MSAKEPTQPPKGSKKPKPPPAPSRPRPPRSQWLKDGVPYAWDDITGDPERDRRSAEDRGEIPMRLLRRFARWWNEPYRNTGPR